MSLLNSLILRTTNQPAINGIPPYRKELLFISYDEPSGHGFGLQFTISISSLGDVGMNQKVPDDPSTIYSTLSATDPSAQEDVPKLSYFPSYSGMVPTQRGLYLRWLCDVTQEIDIGYVFVYFYGLERHLLYGNFDVAFDEILLLRKHHNNGSFHSYSASALVHSCLLRKRIDRLQQLYESGDFDYFDNSNLLILFHNGLDVLPDMLLRLAAQLSGVNRRYVRLKPELYEQQLSEILIRKFGKPSYPLSSRFSLDEVEGVPYPIFANISFSPDVRTPRLPNFFQHAPFASEMGTIFSQTHEVVKSLLTRKKRSGDR